jgi:hypothetical protein
MFLEQGCPRQVQHFVREIEQDGQGMGQVQARKHHGSEIHPQEEGQGLW